jgi:hypothetical protein
VVPSIAGAVRAVEQVLTRYKCPACERDFQTVSGIRKHWNNPSDGHPLLSCPILSAEATRIA